MSEQDKLILSLAETHEGADETEEIKRAADDLFPELESLLDFKTEFGIEEKIMNYAFAFKHLGFLDGYHAAERLKHEN